MAALSFKLDGFYYNYFWIKSFNVNANSKKIVAPNLKLDKFYYNFF